MRVTTKLTISMVTGEVLSHDYYEYDGPVAEAKKGRQQSTAAANQGNAIGQMGIDDAAQNRQSQLGYKAKSDAAANQLFTMPANGGLNPYLADQFAREKEQIGKTYSDAAGVGTRSLASRGMGGAPTGMEASITNTAGRNAGEATTNAYGEQLKNQLGLGLEGVKYNQGQQQLYDPARMMEAGTGGVNAAANAAGIRSKMGNGFTDVGAALSGLSGLMAG